MAEGIASPQLYDVIIFTLAAAAAI